MVLCLKHLPKRTKYGNDLYGRVIGFKRFLETTQKDKLNKFAGDNPNYFKDILPYAYVLDISNKWIKQFEQIIDVSDGIYAQSLTNDISLFSKEIDNSKGS